MFIKLFFKIIFKNSYQDGYSWRGGAIVNPKPLYGYTPKCDCCFIIAHPLDSVVSTYKLQVNSSLCPGPTLTDSSHHCLKFILESRTLLVQTTFLTLRFESSKQNQSSFEATSLYHRFEFLRKMKWSLGVSCVFSSRLYKSWHWCSTHGVEGGKRVSLTASFENTPQLGIISSYTFFKLLLLSFILIHKN